MKKMFYLIIIVLFITLFTSCKTTVYNLKAPCKGLTAEELFDYLTVVVTQEGMTVIKNNPKVGLFVAETGESLYPSGYLVNKIWTINLNKNKELIANAKATIVQKNAFGTIIANNTVYYNDDDYDVDDDEGEWYWTVRKALEEQCNNTITIEEKKISH